MAGTGRKKGALHAKAPSRKSSRLPQIRTRRLTLRGLRLDDAGRIGQLLGDRAIARNTEQIPHPYGGKEAAEDWIRKQREAYLAGQSVTFAIAPRNRKQLIGMIGLELAEEHNLAEMGFWIGKPYWNKGYVTEAAEAVLRYGFETLGLNRIWAAHFGSNPASGRVMKKLGMTYEGTWRQHVLKWGTFEDLCSYGILREEFETRERR